MTGISERLAAALADRYRMERELGQGGMATVYLAQDLKHDRKVALKVLKPELAAVLGAERFVVEIKTTAALQHPHILPLFDSGTADSFLFYVMPFIDGETVRGKLDREGQFAVDEAVQIARDVAEALDYAHQHGVIHRDIKPENILLANGRPMVADFGIALAVSAAAGGRMTETGLSLGTPHYMSPEQATAEKEITARSDVYSLGSVLYEMLTGEPPHIGNSAQAIIMKIVTEEAQPVTRLRKSVPPNVAAAVAKAVERLPADRFPTAKAFAEALGNPAFTTAKLELAGGTHAGRGAPRGALVGLAIAGLAAAALAAWGWLRSPPPPPVVRYQFALPADQSPAPIGGAPTAAPDGSFIVYHGAISPGEQRIQLWLKRRDSEVASPIAGTVEARSFAISPDGKSIVYDAAGQLREVAVSGGTPLTLVPDLVASAGVAWLEDGTRLFVRLRNGYPALASLPAGGGDPEFLIPGDSLVSAVPMPIWGTSGVLYARCLAFTSCETWALDRRDGSTHRILSGVSAVAYSETGHLVVAAQDGQLLGIPFDAERLEVSGPAVALRDGVAALNVGVPMTLSRSGTLILALGASRAGFDPFDMVWVDRSGGISPVDTAWRFQLTTVNANQGWALSPDGSRLAIGLNTPAGDDIWVKQLPEGPVARVSFDSAAEFRPRWTPDGRSVTFISTRSPQGVYQRRADATGEDSLLLAGLFQEALISPSGEWLVVRAIGVALTSGQGREIQGRRIGGDTTLVPVLATRFDEMAPAISPDGQWMAYQSDETGRTEVFVRSFPETDNFKRQVSRGGGVAPLWSRDGRELFYLGAGTDMMAAPFATSPTPTIGQPARLFQVPAELLVPESTFYTPWDVAPDGRFIMARLHQAASQAAPTLVVAENWLTELNARVPR